MGIKMLDNPEEKLLILQLSEDCRKIADTFERDFNQNPQTA